MYDLLKQINSPDDLKKLAVEQLTELAEQIREFMLETVSKTGGHLASSLGVVELTLALHYVFDFKQDKLLWDVGHQCYTHKIITGRQEQFGRLRQGGGLSGFPDPAESPYDQFTVGHAGTAVPTAIGMALGQYQTKQADKIVALVGDASIVNGVSFEALNNMGLVKRQLLVVLNDNSMAIDVTQGALAKYFSKIRLSHTYEDLRKTTNNILEHLPLIGKGVEEALEKIKKTIRMTVSGGQIFESLNIPYFGPVDGHDIESLVQLFKAISEFDHPAILHVYTKKGKGFTPAEKNHHFHSTGPFEMDGEVVEPASIGTKRSFTNCFSDAIVELAKDDEKIIAITSAMCDGTGLADFRVKFSDRFYDVGLAESVAVDIAAGLAKSGLKPVVCIYSTFLQRSFDQIFQEVALQNLPVVFCIDRAGLVGADGPTHHGLMDIGFLRMMPNMVLLSVANEIELKLALKFALSSDKSVCIRYPRDFVTSNKLADLPCSQPFELGKSVAVKESSKSVLALVSYGDVLYEAIQAAQQLEQEGIVVDIINARFAAPIDEKIISLLVQGKALITIEDHSIACGFGSAVLECAAKAFPKGIPKQIATLGIPKHFVRHNGRKLQLMDSGVNADNIIQTAKDMLSLNE